MKKVLSIIVSLMLIVSPVYALDSEGVIYDNSTSGSSATNVESALNDLYSKLNEKQTEINNIKNIGNATSDKILSGYTAYVKGNTITGSIPSKGATTYTPGTVNQTIASGNYLSGAQTIKGDANLVAANIAKGKSIFGISGTYTSDANAIAGNILSGKTAYVNGSKITGTMPVLTSAALNSGYIGHANASEVMSGAYSDNDTTNYLYLGIPGNTYTGNNVWIRTPMTEVIKQLPSKGATTYTPGVSNQTIASGSYLSGTQTIKGDANLVASNIAKGKTIFGVSGTYTSDATATAADIKSGKTAYVNGSKVTGTNTGGDYKVYKFDKIQATVDSNQTFTLGTWKKIVTTGTHTVHFKIPLGFTPTEEISCYAYLSGNYKTTSTSTETSYNFRFKNGNYSYLYLLTSYLNVGQTALNSTNVQNVITCQVSGDKLVLQIEGVKSSGGLAEPIYETRADIFYLSGTLVYK